MNRALHTRKLHAGWVYRAGLPGRSARENLAEGDDWRPATVPGTVYQDLIAQQVIPDPHFGTHEDEVQWVADKDWCYRLDFEAPREDLSDHADLVLEGLDTFARVFLNGELILESTNMFVPARIDVRARLKEGSNRLGIQFDSALRRGRDMEIAHGRRHLWNGDTSRLHVRKAQYHYGWDWGPVLMTAGPWRPISIETYDVRFNEIDSPVHLNRDLTHARVDVRVQLSGDVAAGLGLRCTLRDPEGKVVAEAQHLASSGAGVSLHIDRPALWWPVGHGGQPLYTLDIELRHGARVVDHRTRRLGMRTVRLVQEPVAGERGHSFCFEVNGREMFIGGANWIPDDNLLNRITPARYRERVHQAAAGNMAMLRVWGGGIYEDDAFYDACDELGVLVWQDFLFACGIYPAHDTFLRSVKAEASAAVRRLRHRASLALWCGNNEDYAIAESIGLHGKSKDSARFDARAIYERLLPGICARLDPQRPYWPGSPYSPSATDTLNSDDPSVGDRHTWEVWHGTMLPYQQYHTVQGRFVSEFGMQSHPSIGLLERAVPENERFPLSRTMSAHNKAGSGKPDGHRRLAVYVADTLNAGPTLADAVYATQFVQAEAMRYAYQDFRHRWQTPGRRAVGGALVWQLNDCWPGTSWAVIDAAGTVKPAWHAIRRALAPTTVAVRVTDNEARGWIANSGPEAACSVRLKTHPLAGGVGHEAVHELSAMGNASTDFALPIPAGEPAVAEVSLCIDGRCVATDWAWPEPYRFHPLGPCGLRAVRTAGGLLLGTDRPAKGVWLDAEGVEFSDNFLDLMPGKPMAVTLSRSDRPIRVVALDQPAVEV